MAEGMKDRIATMVTKALKEAQKKGLLPDAAAEDLGIDRPQDLDHGDFASSLPLKLARTMRMNPMAIAEQLVSQIPTAGDLADVSAAPPGFINFTLSQEWITAQVELIRQAGDSYGDTDIGEGKRVQVEFVSVNPTGPIHVGHARGAVFGSALAQVLEAAGYQVEREYYLNDAGNQIEQFNLSLHARYRQELGEDAKLPEDGYVGDYMVDLARDIKAAEGDRFAAMPEADAVRQLGELGLKAMVDAIRDDMARLRVEYDVWFSERSLYTDGKYDHVMGLLRDGGFLIERDGATWFKSKALGDNEDRVMVRGTGAPTYLASDAPYHYDKLFERKFDKVIDVWGADHQGQVLSMKALVRALGADPERVTLLIYQLVTLKRGDKAVRLSKRAGEIATLRELVDEVGPDACRFVFLSRAPDTQMEFDLELAKQESSENPVYYVQYAHARIAGILREAAKREIDHTDGDVSLLTHEAELTLVRKMLEFPELVEMMAENLEPHHLPHYSIELATTLQRFYEQCRVVSSKPEDAEMTKARLKLVEAAKVVLSRCLGLMLMDAPERM